MGLLIVMLWTGIAFALVLAWYALRLPDLAEIENFDRRPSLAFVASTGETIGTTGDLHAGIVRLHEVPPFLVQALMATEDRRFYGHLGIDPLGLAPKWP